MAVPSGVSAASPPSAPAVGGPTTDFRPGVPDLALFPRAAWSAAYRRALARLPNDALGYPDPRGLPELRRALAGLLARRRGIAVDPDRLIVGSGVAQALTTICQVARRRGHRLIAVEDPGSHDALPLYAAGGLTAVPVTVDGDGLDVAGLAASGARIAVVTPSHQFPPGIAYSAARRAELTGWARSADGLVVEDDYDGDFRYDREPVEPTPWKLRKCPVQGMMKPRPARGRACQPGSSQGSAVQVPLVVQRPKRGHETGQRARTAGVLRERPRMPAQQAADHPLMLRVRYRFAAAAGALVQGVS